MITDLNSAGIAVFVIAMIVLVVAMFYSACVLASKDDNMAIDKYLRMYERGEITKATLDEIEKDLL